MPPNDKNGEPKAAQAERIVLTSDHDGARVDFIIAPDWTPAIRINVGGNVVVKTARAWHEAAWSALASPSKLAQVLAEARSSETYRNEAAALSAASPINEDRAYVNGAIFGWNCGVAGDEKKFSAAIDGRETEIHATPSSARSQQTPRCLAENAKPAEDQDWCSLAYQLEAAASATSAQLPDEATEAIVDAMCEGYTAHFENPKMVIGENMKNVYRALVAFLRQPEGAGS